MTTTVEAAVPAQVSVTVTTIRVEQADGLRRAHAEGPLDDAVREALEARLEPWGVDQVLGRVLARRPPAGEAASYEGSFHPLRRIRVEVTPAIPAGATSPLCRRRRLPGLFLPEPDPTAFVKDGRP